MRYGKAISIAVHGLAVAAVIALPPETLAPPAAALRRVLRVEIIAEKNQAKPADIVARPPRRVPTIPVPTPALKARLHWSPPPTATGTAAASRSMAQLAEPMAVWMAPPAQVPPVAVAALPEAPRAVVANTGFERIDTTAPLPKRPAAPAATLTTGGFGGVAAQGSSGAASGSVVNAGFGAATPTAGASGPRNGAAGVVQSGGFGTAGVAVAASAARRAVERPGGFETVTRAAAAAVPVAPRTESTSRGLEIVMKPKPAYTDEARRRQIEGEVVLEAEFTAAGVVRVLRVVRGLGHGLDEAAVAAAQGIRFRPAEREGAAVSTVAQVRMVFQLAF